MRASAEASAASVTQPRTVVSRSVVRDAALAIRPIVYLCAWRVGLVRQRALTRAGGVVA